MNKRTDEELRKLAVDWVEGRIFTSLDIPPGELEQMLTKVFLLLGLGAFSDWPKKKINDIGILYEYMANRGHRSVNGFPQFITSCHWLNKADTKKWREYALEYHKQRTAFVKEKP